MLDAFHEHGVYTNVTAKTDFTKDPTRFWMETTDLG